MSDIVERLKIQVSNLRSALDSSVDLNAELKAEIERLRGEVVETTRRAGRLVSLLRDARAEVDAHDLSQQISRELAEIDEALEPK